MNRGVARRPVFESDRDAGQFLSQLSAVVELGLLEIHAYTLMSNHMHLLVRSLEGRLAEAMKLVLNGYSRWFNRRRRRDGPLWRGRFLSKRARTSVYRATLVRYIDHNPVSARLVAHPADYPWGSAWHHAGRGQRPAWLCGDLIDAIIERDSLTSGCKAERYGKVFGDPLPPSLSWAIERHGFSQANPELAIARILSDQDDSSARWLSERITAADGPDLAPLPAFSPAEVLAHVAAARTSRPDWSVRAKRKVRDGWLVLTCALLFRLSACSPSEVAQLTGIDHHRVRRLIGEHQSLIHEHADYATTTTRLIDRLTRACRG